VQFSAKAAEGGRIVPREPVGAVIDDDSETKRSHHRSSREWALVTRAARAGFADGGTVFARLESTLRHGTRRRASRVRGSRRRIALRQVASHVETRGRTRLSGARAHCLRRRRCPDRRTTGGERDRAEDSRDVARPASVADACALVQGARSLRRARVGRESSSRRTCDQTAHSRNCGR